MKLYRPFQRRFVKHFQAFKKFLPPKVAGELQYMDVKELSERMEQARTAAQFAVLRYKYDTIKTRQNKEEVRQAISLYMERKQRYYDDAQAYLAQCQKPEYWQRPVANDSLISNHRRSS